MSRTPAVALGLLIVLVLAGLDAHWGQTRIISATVVIGPFVAALSARPRAALAVGGVAIAAAVLSGSWHHNWGTLDYVVRVVVVVAGSLFAWLTARSLARLEVDRHRFQILAGAATISDVASTPQDTVSRLSALLVPDVADVCIIDVERSDRIERLAVAASGPRAAEIEAGLRRRAEASALPAHGDAAGMRSGRPILIEEATDALLVEAAHDDADLAFLRSLGARSTMMVPLRARGRSIGAMALMTTADSGRRYTADHLEFAKVLSGRVALALDNAGLFAELETLEAQQTAALGSLAEAVTIQNALGQLVYANDAAARALGFPSAEELLRTPPQDIVDAFESFLEDGRPLRVEDLPGRRVLAGERPEPLLIRSVNRRTGEERWRVTKATPVLDPEGRPRLAVNVIEDVTEVKRAEVAQRFLARAGALLASSLDHEETLAQVARLAVPELADWCSVTMPDERGFLRPVGVAHADPEKVQYALEYGRRWPARTDDPTGAAQVLRDGEAQLWPEIPESVIDEAVPDPEQREQIKALQMRAAMIVPMVAPGRGVIGVITFVSAESGRRFTEADLGMALELGRRAGTAVENARLYTERTHIARTLQAGLLPDELPDVPGFAMASLYRPAGEENFVGGDFYDAFAAGDGWMVIVGDITGRGAEAAALTGQARHTLRTAGTLLGDPVRSIEVLNEALAGRRELSICTAAAVQIVEEPGGATRARVVCAGHPRPLRVRGGEVEAVEASGPVVGAWHDSAWKPAEVALEPGDLLVLYTDGVTDSMGDDGERFGEERLAAALREAGAAGAGAQEAVAAVLDALRAFERGPQADDTALVVLQRVAAPPARRRWAAPAVPESVGRLRNAVAEFARGAGLADERIGELRLAVSEALTNAVVHGYRNRGDGPLIVHARAADDRFEVTVEDEGVGPAPRPDSPGAGVGLPVMAALTLETNIAARAGGGTVVQLVFPLA